jgi:hypothetical protein
MVMPVLHEHHRVPGPLSISYSTSFKRIDEHAEQLH